MRNVDSQLLTNKQFQERNNSCREKEICFVSLKPLNKDAREVDGVLVNPQYILF